MRNITLHDITCNKPLGKCIVPGHIQYTSLLAPATWTFYVKEEPFWRTYIFQMAYIITGCDPIERRQSQVYHPPELIFIESIEHKG